MKHTQLMHRVTLVTLLVLALGEASPALAPRVLVNAQRGKVGETITFTVSLDQATKAVEALGLTLVYDPTVLRYTGTFTKGPLVQGFDFFGVHERQPGQIRVGGFTTKEAIAQGAQGDLVSLVFTVISAGNTTIQIAHLVDGLAGLTAVPGTFTGEMSSLPGTPPATTLATQMEPTEAGVIPSTASAISQIDATQVKNLLESGTELIIIDVRSTAAFQRAHIRGAVSMPLAEVAERYSELPHNKTIVAYCA